MNAVVSGKQLTEKQQMVSGRKWKAIKGRVTVLMNGRMCLLKVRKGLEKRGCVWKGVD